MPIALISGLIFHRKLSRYKIALFSTAFLVSLGILAARAIIPYVRMWVFVLPIYLMTVSAGCFWLYGRLRRWLKTANAA